MTFLPLAAAAVLWGVVFASVPPGRQDFPLNDDWAYSKGAFALARGKGFRYDHQGSMPLLGQWALSYPVIRIVGGSHAALRLVTIALSLLGTLALSDLLRCGSGFRPWEVRFAASVFAADPLVFLLSGTFMSDVPTLGLSLAALASYARALRDGSRGWLASAAVAAVLAAVNRQNAVVVPVVAGALLLRRQSFRLRPVWWLGVLTPMAAGVAAHLWFTARPDAVALAPKVPTAADLIILGVSAATYSGLAALPVLLLRPGIVFGRVFIAALLVISAGALYCHWSYESLHPPYALYGGLFPYLGNQIGPWGAFDSTNNTAGIRPVVLGLGFRETLTVAACLGGAALVDRAVARLKGRPEPNPLFLYTVLQGFVLVISPTLFDRYMIVLFPGALAVAGGASFPRRPAAALTALAISAACSVGLAHDWLAWNSARWEVGRRAVASGVRPEDVEGGLEWDGWYATVPVASDHLPLPPRGLVLSFNRYRYPHLTGRFALAFSKLQGTEILDDEPYQFWLAPGERRFLLLGAPGEKLPIPTGRRPETAR